MTAHTPEDSPEQEADERPSKSARKRAAHAAQDLGETLIRLRDAELDALGLPERLTEAIREARRITSRAGGARQRQYIGKLMREIDPEPIRAALAARSERDALESQLFKRAEGWRERLIVEGESALDELARLRPGLDREEWAAGWAQPAPSGRAARPRRGPADAPWDRPAGSCSGRCARSSAKMPR